MDALLYVLAVVVFFAWFRKGPVRREADRRWADAAAGATLHQTPAHPDYPSGHNTYSGAAEVILDALAGPRTAPFALTSPTAPGVQCTYTSSADEAGVTPGSLGPSRAARGRRS
ncbi:hypothetical protein ACFVX6_13660 [Streptomyces sp. NPDC058289]|uniref:hypothetical protein n=1 Tax=Streptomyces sp. NPDC058289 TaxID=3346425 RepID=UPI0036F0999A